MFKKMLNDQRGVEGWITLIIALSFFTLIIGLTIDFRNELNKKSVFNEVVLSCKELFQEEGGLTPVVENEIINRLESAGFDASDITITGSSRCNYGAKITYTVTLKSMMKVGNDTVEKEYRKKVLGTSAFIPEG